MWDTVLNEGKQHTFVIPENHNAVILLLRGTVQVGSEHMARRGDLIAFERGGSKVLIEANNEAKLLILTGEPLNEPIAGHGPFVMNTREELIQAFQDFQKGDFGRI